MYHVSALGVDERMINLRYSSSSSYLHIMVLRGWGWWPKQPVGVRVFLTCISWCYGDGDQNSQWVLGCFLPAYHGVMGMVTNTASGCWGVSYLHIMVLCGWGWWPKQPVGVGVFLTCISWCYGDGDQHSQWVFGCFLPAHHGVVWMGMVTNTASGCWGVSYLHIMVLWGWWPKQPVGVGVFLTCTSWCCVDGDGDQNSQWVLGCFLPAYHGVMGMVTNTASGCWGVSYLHIMVLWGWWPTQPVGVGVFLTCISWCCVDGDGDQTNTVSWMWVLPTHWSRILTCITLCHGWSFWST